MSVEFAMAIHFHQPVGNFDHVIENAFEKCYMPFLNVLKKYPEIKMNFHFTGCLLEWAEAKKPELFDIISGMVRSGQVEIMSGGFYEPILASIPERDRLSQVKMLNKYVKEKFSFDPQGAWVAERVWEPSLPSVFYDSGLKYVILDDTHFLYSGISGDRIHGYYITEDNGKTVGVFPSDKVLRYHIPYKPPAECMDYMRKYDQKENPPVFVYGDDGEKFGEWPGTYNWVYKEKWLEKFFDEIMKNSGWLSTVKLSECMAARSPLGRVYFPTTSYEEMLEWALPANSQEHMEDVINDMRNSGKEDFYKAFIRGGFWRNFLAKYPESNNMNKKMLYISGRLDKLRGEGKDKNDIFKEAEKDLFRGQCNCSYWHGIFGGLYLFHLRESIYRHLIRSEAGVNNILHGDKDFIESEVLDVDADGMDEVIIRNKELSLLIDPAEGGALKELDIMSRHHNMINSLARRKEAYHRKILKKLESQEHTDDVKVKTIHDGCQKVDPSIKNNLDYDWYTRYSLLDHFIGKDTDIEAFSRCAYEESGDFVIEPYVFSVNSSMDGEKVVLERNGNISGSPVKITKEIMIGTAGSSFKVHYKILNTSDKPVDSIFGVEFNVTMPESDSERYFLVAGNDKKPCGLNKKVAVNNADNISIKDSGGELSFELLLSEGFNVWSFPVKTVSQSEKAYELNYQSSVIFPFIDIFLDEGACKEFDIYVNLYAPEK